MSYENHKKFNLLKILTEAENTSDITSSEFGKGIIDGIQKLVPTLGVEVESIRYTSDTKTVTLKGNIKGKLPFTMTNNRDESGFFISATNYIKVDGELLDGEKKLHGFYSATFAPEVQKAIADGSIKGNL